MLEYLPSTLCRSVKYYVIIKKGQERNKFLSGRALVKFQCSRPEGKRILNLQLAANGVLEVVAMVCANW